MATALEPEHDVTQSTDLRRHLKYYFTDLPQYLQCQVALRHLAYLRFSSLQLLNYVRLHDPYAVFWLRRLLAVVLPVAFRSSRGSLFSLDAKWRLSRVTFRPLREFPLPFLVGVCSSSAEGPVAVEWSCSAADVADKITTSMSRNSGLLVFPESYPVGNWCTVIPMMPSFFQSELAHAQEMSPGFRTRSSLNCCCDRTIAGAYGFCTQPDHRPPSSCRPLLPWYQIRPYGNACAVLNSHVRTMVLSRRPNLPSCLAVLAPPCAAHDIPALPSTS
jgi:hypothetical protein